MLSGDSASVRLGWIGLGRMGSPMAARLLKAGREVSVWNRTRSKAEPLAGYGGRIADGISELAGCDVVFTMVSTGQDLKSVCFGPDGLLSQGDNPRPSVVVDCSSISVGDSAEVRERLRAHGIAFVCAPVSGNGKCAKAGMLSAVMSDPSEDVC